MSEITINTDEHKENQDNESSSSISNQKTETNKVLFDNLDYKEKSGEDDEISEEDFLNYYGYENENELKYSIKIRGNRDFHDNCLMISNDDLQSFLNKEDFSPFGDDLQFYIIKDTIKNHTFKEIKEHRSEIVDRRNSVLMLSDILRRFSFDILNDWSRIEELGLTDDKLSSRDSMNLREIEELSSILSIDQLEIAMKLTRKDIFNLINIKKSSNLNGIRFENLLELKNCTPEDVQRAKKNADYLGIEEFSSSGFIILKDISKDALEYCSENNIKDTSQMKLIKEIYTLKDKESLKEYIGRKNKYLSKNRTISEEKFIEYFGKKGKHGKHDIQQGKFGVCYMYSAIDALKKMNGFDELIQTNLIENDDGWLVRLPFQIGSWIQVGKDEIDKNYGVMDNSAMSVLLRQIFDNQIPRRIIRINSNTESLGIKILEIACIKNMLINGKISIDYGNIHETKFINSKLKKGRGTIKSPLNLKNITGDMLENIEGGDSLGSLMEILGKGNVSSGIYNSIHDILKEKHIERLKSRNAGKFIINQQKKYLDSNGKFKDIAFGSFKSGFILINVSVDNAAIDKLGEWKNKKEKIISTDDVKILDRTGKEIHIEKLKRKSDASIDKAGNISARFFANHAYSIEKCYINEEGEKRMRVVNPWHTEMKFDIPFERCRNHFIREVGVIKIGNLFK